MAGPMRCEPGPAKRSAARIGVGIRRRRVKSSVNVGTHSDSADFSFPSICARARCRSIDGFDGTDRCGFNYEHTLHIFWIHL